MEAGGHNSHPRSLAQICHQSTRSVQSAVYSSYFVDNGNNFTVISGFYLWKLGIWHNGYVHQNGNCVMVVEVAIRCWLWALASQLKGDIVIVTCWIPRHDACCFTITISQQLCEQKSSFQFTDEETKVLRITCLSSPIAQSVWKSRDRIVGLFSSVYVFLFVCFSNSIPWLL